MNENFTFDTMEYVRPDVEAFGTRIQEYAKALGEATD